MWRRIKPIMPSMALSLVLWTGLEGTPAWAGVDVNVNIGIPLPPPIVVTAPPSMVFLAEPGVYVAVGVPYDIFFISGYYYYLHGGYWYRARGYGGPWGHTTLRSLPPGLRKYKVERLHVFRDREFERYTVQGPHYRGRRFQAVAGPGSQGGDGIKAGRNGPDDRKRKGRNQR